MNGTCWLRPLIGAHTESNITRQQLGISRERSIDVYGLCLTVYELHRAEKGYKVVSAARPIGGSIYQF
jgi:hypothetical protein